MNVPIDPHLDLAKFVGAASAPVALIIATSIIVSNLGGRYALLAGFFRAANAELRDLAERESARARGLLTERTLLKRRLRLLTWATSWLFGSIIMFTATVIFTGVAILFPTSRIFEVLVVLLSFSGAAMLVLAVIISVFENNDAYRSTKLE